MRTFFSTAVKMKLKKNCTYSPNNKKNEVDQLNVAEIAKLKKGMKELETRSKSCLSCVGRSSDHLMITLCTYLSLILISFILSKFKFI